jgi:hypothetical protein
MHYQIVGFPETYWEIGEGTRGHIADLLGCEPETLVEYTPDADPDLRVFYASMEASDDPEAPCIKVRVIRDEKMPKTLAADPEIRAVFPVGHIGSTKEFEGGLPMPPDLLSPKGDMNTLIARTRTRRMAALICQHLGHGCAPRHDSNCGATCPFSGSP